MPRTASATGREPGWNPAEVPVLSLPQGCLGEQPQEVTCTFGLFLDLCRTWASFAFLFPVLSPQLQLENVIAQTPPHRNVQYVEER